MARKKKSLLTILLVIGLLYVSTKFIFVTKDSPQNQAVRIRVAFWGSLQEKAIIEGLVGKHNQSFPRIQIDLQHELIENYAPRILTRIAGQVAPDIVFAEANMFVTFCKKNVLLDLTDYLQNTSDLDPKDFFPQIMNWFTVDGHVYGLPRDIAPIACVYYNKSVFDEKGLPYPADDWNWDDFLKAAIRLTKKDASGKIVRYGFYTWYWQNFIYSNGGQLVDDVRNPTRCLLAEPEAISGFKFYSDLFQVYRVSPVPHPADRIGMGVHELFRTGKLAMFLSGIWDAPEFRSIQNFDWDIAMFPKGPTGLRAFATGGSGYCILKSSHHPDEAWEVLKYLSGPEGQSTLARAGLAQPALRAIAQGPAWEQNAEKPLNKGMLNKAVEYVVLDPFDTKWREAMEKYVYPQLDNVFNELETPGEVFGRITPTIDKFLQK